MLVLRKMFFLKLKSIMMLTWGVDQRHPLAVQIHLFCTSCKIKSTSHMRQYIKNKPTKWGFTFWVISDPTGYTINFNVYAESRQASEQSGNGLGYDVVMKMVQAFMFQGYELYIDNFYSSYFKIYKEQTDVRVTGTVNMTRKNKPMKWAFKYWVLSDQTGYTLDFNIYQGSTAVRSGRGVAYDAVMELIQPFHFQGYHLYCDNFYSSPSSFEELRDDGICATGTLRTD